MTNFSTFLAALGCVILTGGAWGQAPPSPPTLPDQAPASKPAVPAPQASATPSEPQFDLSSESFDQTRAVLQKLADEKQAYTNELREWEQGKAILQQRIELVDREIENTKAKITEHQEKLAASRKKKEELEAEKAVSEKGAEYLRGQVEALEAKVRALQPRMPKPVRDKINLLWERMPPPGDQEKSAKISLAERFQNILGILGEFNKANTEVIHGLETIPMPGGQQAEVSVVYFGLGQAYYLTKDGERAGYGKPSEVGWVWTEDNSITSGMLDILNMLKKSGHPRMVQLPIKIE